jgi:glycosyltransferase involved in cell wall biosynthesis
MTNVKISKPRILVAQLGARRHYQQPILFHEWGILDTLYTDFYSGHNWVAQLLRHAQIYNHLPNLMKNGLDRYAASLKNARIIHFPRFGYQYAQALRKASNQKASLVFLWAGKEFCHRIIQNGLGEANVVYGFNSASLELFEYAKERGIRCILDQTLAERSLVHQLLLEEEQYWPEWSLSPFQVNEADLDLVQQEQREQDLADHIICGSNFVKDSLIARGVNANKISVVALGRRKNEQLAYPNTNRQTPQERGDGLKILFAGTVGLRKGIPYLLEALRLIKGKIPFTCKVAGSIEIKPQYVADYRNVCDFMGRVPRSQMADLYAWADVFVLPSICEGSAMVIYEALTLEIPVITTPNSGSIVRDKVDGFIIDIREPKKIAEAFIDIFQCNIYSPPKNKDSTSYVSAIYKASKINLYKLITRWD